MTPFYHYRTVNAQDFALAAQFVLPYEMLCCSLMEKILAYEDSIFLITAAMPPRTAQDIHGVVCCTNGGLVLPCLPIRTPEVQDALQELLRDYDLFCISGEMDFVRFLNQAVIANGIVRCGEWRPYLFMEYRGDGKPSLLDGALQQTVCTAHDANELLPLHLAYLQEEVLPSFAERPRIAAECMNLQYALKTYYSLALWHNGTAIAKAQVNAQSPHYMQIGGVYTQNQWRCRGYAGTLTQAIALHARQQGKQAILFAKEKNTSALHAYQRVGFVPCGAYCIAYYT